MTLALDTKSPLALLSQTLDQACCLDPSSAGFALGVRAALSGLSRETGLLSDAQRESGLDCYRRHLLVADPLGRYAVAALVWQAGQASPVHGHHTWCAYTVIEGALSETLFAWDADAHRAVATRRHERACGAVSFVGPGRGAIHQLGNASATGQTAVSIHVYGVPGAQISTHVNDLVTVAA
ncbi:cysteine dioxygenase family protein [Caballeronia sp. SEWSISQ10-4 2]|uniref:cysteine dioxygenase family protein n=1 Tax=Caballeronia sp. SEWSISQ10-4 2 TaxID=2937438 RepID=UPI002653E22B|nr:cysteine dioxygenase family protein [Caballeronia sp. SEWSISQ10-4 2]MDN7176489.1 cysteine dioxygenase family protein [Caballeronia sp. SEWSISQ10-4 2]